MEEFEECYKKLRNRKIVLFGAGSYGKLMIRALKDIGMYENIYAICDNDSTKYGKILEGGVRICNIEDILSKTKDFIVVISSQFEDEIRESLEKYNVEIFEKPVYEAFVEQMLSFYVYNTTIINGIFDVYKWIGEYYDEYSNEPIDELISLMSDDESRVIIENRFFFIGLAN